MPDPTPTIPPQQPQLSPQPQLSQHSPQPQHSLQPPPSSPSSARPRSKVVVALLGLFLGVFGAHAWYLRRSYAWCITLAAVVCLIGASQYPVWFENPLFFLLLLPIVDGFIQALVYSLMSDEQFDRRFNPEHPGSNRTSAAPICIAIVTVLWGAVVMMFGIAMVVLYIWEAMGWLDISGY